MVTSIIMDFWLQIMLLNLKCTWKSGRNEWCANSNSEEKSKTLLTQDQLYNSWQIATGMTNGVQCTCVEFSRWWRWLRWILKKVPNQLTRSVEWSDWFLPVSVFLEKSGKIAIAIKFCSESRWVKLSECCSMHNFNFFDLSLKPAKINPITRS